MVFNTLATIEALDVAYEFLVVVMVLCCASFWVLGSRRRARPVKNLDVDDSTWVNSVWVRPGRCSPIDYCVAIKGFLKDGNFEDALDQLKQMQTQRYKVPPFAVTKICRVACDAGSCIKLLDLAEDSLPLNSEAVTVLMKDCHKRNDLTTALRIEKLARAGNIPLQKYSCDALLMICVMHGDQHAFDVLEEAQNLEGHLGTGLCLCLLSRCSDSKFFRFAEKIMAYLRNRSETSLSAYSALMKVYACCGMYDKACDLYELILKEGMEPDSIMYGCLMKFSVECGRTDLSQELSKKSPALDIQSYMSLIQAAGRDKDVDRAFAVLAKMKAAGFAADIAAYTCVLDACVIAGDMTRARELMAEMQTIGALDTIAYNTLLKGYCTVRDLKGAKELLLEMDAVGQAPNEISYNCLINIAAASGDFTEAYSIIDRMEHQGFPIDNYTISIIMKSLKKTARQKDIVEAFKLLDRSGVVVHSDEVLMNTVLEMCIRHREFKRLEKLIDSCKSAEVHHSVHTYGLFIKAFSALKQVDQCWELWRTMTEQQDTTPSDYVLGCMMSALVFNNLVRDALALFEEWKGSVPMNTFMYSTLIKGLTSNNRSEDAMQLYQEMKEKNVECNKHVFTTLIDCQARIGATDKVAELVKTMEECGCQRDAITNSTIIKGYVMKGDIEEAFEVFSKMSSSSKTDDSTYNTILDGCVRHQRMDIADSVLADMQRQNVRPSNVTMSVLVKMYGRRKQLNKAFEVIEENRQKWGLEPNVRVLSSLMCACLSCNSMEKANAVFDQMKSDAYGVDAKSYCTLISNHVRHGNLQEAVRLVKEAYGLGQRRHLQSSQKLEDETMEQLMRSIVQYGKIESLGKPLLEQLRASKVPVSCRFFSSMFAGGKTAPRN